MRPIDSIVIHCSNTTHGDREILDKRHKQNGWREICYHYILLNGKRKNNVQYNIKDDGHIKVGRHIDNDTSTQFDEIGSRIYGFISNSILVCLIGKDKFTPRQFENLIYLLKSWQCMIPEIKIFGHYETNSKKSCPNFNINDLKELLKSVDLRQKIRNKFENKLG